MTVASGPWEEPGFSGAAAPARRHPGADPGCGARVNRTASTTSVLYSRDVAGLAPIPRQPAECGHGSHAPAAQPGCLARGAERAWASRLHSFPRRPACPPTHAGRRTINGNRRLARQPGRIASRAPAFLLAPRHVPGGSEYPVAPPEEAHRSWAFDLRKSRDAPVHIVNRSLRARCGRGRHERTVTIKPLLHLLPCARGGIE